MLPSWAQGPISRPLSALGAPGRVIAAARMLQACNGAPGWEQGPTAPGAGRTWHVSVAEGEGAYELPLPGTGCHGVKQALG